MSSSLERTRVLLQSLSALGERLRATALLVVSDRPEFIEQVKAEVKTPILLATSDEDVRATFLPDVREATLLSESMSGSIGVLTQLKELLLSSFLNGTIRRKDRILCIVSNVDALDVIVFFDVDKDIELTHLREELKDRVDMNVIERLLHIAGELAREGREGQAVGTLFVIGDTPRVLELSRQVVINPFHGHPESARNILDEALTETTKEFAQIDGAFVIRDDGVIEAAGRYIDTDEKVELASGLGGRHLAAASVTRATRAIAVVVSASGAIRVFKDGRVIVMIGRL